MNEEVKSLRVIAPCDEISTYDRRRPVYYTFDERAGVEFPGQSHRGRHQSVIHFVESCLWDVLKSRRIQTDKGLSVALSKAIAERMNRKVELIKAKDYDVVLFLPEDTEIIRFTTTEAVKIALSSVKDCNIALTVVYRALDESRTLRQLQIHALHENHFVALDASGSFRNYRYDAIESLWSKVENHNNSGLRAFDECLVSITVSAANLQTFIVSHENEDVIQLSERRRPLSAAISHMAGESTRGIRFWRKKASDFLSEWI